MVRIPTVSARARIDEERPHHRNTIGPPHESYQLTPSHHGHPPTGDNLNYHIPYNPCTLPIPP
ncbi:hypothetical protein BJV78DRAFT_1190943 [Lactifluus subvellereus]|nr:hypothetical protein BJV78DRAFT_1231475 [Lactifluus subvellereus]KAI0253640.1 hypothetical protein BJV78DRAFT_1190943 [Lactifluus subvellereus]